MTKRVAIIGGGMAGLTTAWWLTRPEGEHPEVTVYQRGARLGGKAASSRGAHGRIEEHGLHVWLGHYDNAFRMLRSCYRELDRPVTDPACPIADWRDGFLPAHAIGLGDTDAGGWSAWLARFPADRRLPGDADADGTVTLPALLDRLTRLVGAVADSLGPTTARPRAVLSSRRPRAERPGGPVAATVPALLAALRAIDVDPRAGRRAREFVDFIAAFVRGILADDLLRRGFGAVDDEELRGWLRRHGAAPATVDGGFVRALHDLAFAYVDGDRTRPSFPAGVGLHLANRTFGDYKGALFWKMRAGMGEVVIAPIYQVLRRRGVRFRFFHRLEEVEVDAAGSAVIGVRLARQVDLRPGLDEYDPLTVVGGLPVFPAAPDLTQLDVDAAVLDHDLESHFCPWSDAGTTRLEVGTDVDEVVLAVSVGMVPHTCAGLLAASDRWRRMVAHVPTVATQALQVWLDADEHELGWRAEPASVTGIGDPFDTYASMSHVLPFESWPGDVGAAPRTAASFCAVLPEAEVPPLDDPEHRASAAARVRAAAEAFLARDAARLWPAAANGDGFRWELLSDPEDRRGADRLDAQYWRANTDPSDRYVQAAPGSARHRLRPDGSGFDHLALAGDWTDNGVNVGCIEAAVVSGIQAANAVEGRPVTAGVTSWSPLGAAPHASEQAVR